MLPMSSQDHNVSVYIWFWYATRKHKWFFQIVLTEGKIACRGVLVALSTPTGSNIIPKSPDK